MICVLQPANVGTFCKSMCMTLVVSPGVLLCQHKSLLYTRHKLKLLQLITTLNREVAWICGFLFYLAYLTDISCKLWFNFSAIDYKKLNRRWDSERELPYDDIVHALQNAIDSYKFRHRSTPLCLGTQLTKFSEITQCNGHYAVQVHSRLRILVPIESSYTTFY